MVVYQSPMCFLTRIHRKTVDGSSILSRPAKLWVGNVTVASEAPTFADGVQFSTDPPNNMPLEPVWSW